MAIAKHKTSTELIENSKKYDKKHVFYWGEAIGDVMIRGDHAWINVNDGANAMGIWVKKEEAKKIKHLGSYKYYGDTVRIMGTFNRACRQHGGDMDIHASKLEVVKVGYQIKHPISRVMLLSAAILSALAAGLFWWERKVVLHRKKTAPPQVAGDYCPYIPEEEK